MEEEEWWKVVQEICEQFSTTEPEDPTIHNSQQFMILSLWWLMVASSSNQCDEPHRGKGIEPGSFLASNEGGRWLTPPRP